MMFETFNVPKFYLQASPVLPLISSGKTNGVVLDIGDCIS